MNRRHYRPPFDAPTHNHKAVKPCRQLRLYLDALEGAILSGRNADLEGLYRQMEREMHNVSGGIGFAPHYSGTIAGLERKVAAK